MKYADLSPKEGSDSEGQAPEPLLNVERLCLEPPASVLHNDDLRDEREDPNHVENRVREQTLQSEVIS